MGHLQELLAALGSEPYSISNDDYKLEIVRGGEQTQIVGVDVKDMNLQGAKSRTIGFPYSTGVTPVRYDPASQSFQPLQRRPEIITPEDLVWLYVLEAKWDRLTLETSPADLVENDLQEIGAGFQKFRNEGLQTALNEMTATAQTFAAATANVLALKDLLKAKAYMAKYGYGSNCIAFVDAQEAADLSGDVSITNAQYIFAAKGEVLSGTSFAFIPNFGKVYVMTNATPGTSWVFNPKAAVGTGHVIAFDVDVDEKKLETKVTAFEARVFSDRAPSAAVKITAA